MKFFCIKMYRSIMKELMIIIKSHKNVKIIIPWNKALMPLTFEGGSMQQGVFYIIFLTKLIKIKRYF